MRYVKTTNGENTQWDHWSVSVVEASNFVQPKSRRCKLIWSPLIVPWWQQLQPGAGVEVWDFLMTWKDVRYEASLLCVFFGRICWLPFCSHFEANTILHFGLGSFLVDEMMNLQCSVETWICFKKTRLLKCALWWSIFLASTSILYLYYLWSCWFNPIVTFHL